MKNATMMSGMMPMMGGMMPQMPMMPGMMPQMMMAPMNGMQMGQMGMMPMPMMMCKMKCTMTEQGMKCEFMPMDESSHGAFMEYCNRMCMMMGNGMPMMMNCCGMMMMGMMPA